MTASGMLVTGGTGVLGGRVVERLRASGLDPRVMSRRSSPGTVLGDLTTGEGLNRAVRGVDTIVHCASSPFLESRRTDVEGTRRLLQAASRADVAHVVYISIVGTDRVQSYPYYKVKLETERVVEASPVPYTILRATQFHDLVLMAVRFLARFPVVAVPRGLPGQPIDSGEVAGCMVELALSEPAGRVPDVGGPEVMTLTDAAHRYLEVMGRRKPIMEFPLPGKTAREIRTGSLTCPENRYGEVRWEEFLRRRFEERDGPKRPR